MPCVMASAADIAALREAIEKKPDTVITIDLEKMTVRTCCNLEFPVKMPESAREALVSGRWDPIQELLDNDDAINARAKALHYV
jgi:3-isopropylmalate/(R)-2-methylmalate dehydratase small subunit